VNGQSFQGGILELLHYIGLQEIIIITLAFVVFLGFPLYTLVKVLKSPASGTMKIVWTLLVIFLPLAVWVLYPILKPHKTT